MPAISGLNLDLLVHNQNADTASFRVTYDVTFTPEERALEDIRWRETLLLHGSDPGTDPLVWEREPDVELGYNMLLRPPDGTGCDFVWSAASDPTFSRCFEFTISAELVDEDKVFYPRDEIRAMIILQPVMASITVPRGTSARSNEIRHEFGSHRGPN